MMRSKARWIAGLMLACLAPFASVSADEAAEAMPGRLSLQASAYFATVQDVDQDTRVVTLRDPEGNLTTFVAGEEVRNLPQVVKGDVVLIEYFEGLAVQLSPADGIRGSAAEVGMARADEGQKPGGSMSETLALVATVEAIDSDSRLVALQGPQRTLVVKASPDIDLSKVKVGDQVNAVYRKSLAVSVMPAPEVSGTVSIKSTSVALVVGVEWGGGTLTMYDGSSHDFKVKGVSVVDVGVSKLSLEGEVYKLTDPKDFGGNYWAAEAGGALGGGGSDVVLKNKKGVIMRLKSTQKGLKLTLAPKGVNVKLAGE